MPLISLLLITFGAYKLHSYDRRAMRAIHARAEAYRHPGLAPTQIQSAEFYRSLYWK